MAKNKPMINGIAYSWSQIEIQLSNIKQTLVGVKKIEYSDEQEIQMNFGAGNMPVSRGHGRVTAEATIELSMEDVEAIRAQIPSGRLNDLNEFDVIVSYLHPDKAKIVTHTIKHCVFNTNNSGSEEGGMEITSELPLNPAYIQWNKSNIIGFNN
jgi:hypothetical protein